MTMDPYVASESTPELTPRQSTSSGLKDYLIGATPLQKRLESVRKQTSFVPTPPQRKIPQCSQLQENIDSQKVAFLLHKQWTLYSILSKSQMPSENREGKVLWTGWFCCVFGDNLLETVSQDFTCLPLFLANGAESNTAIIGTWFQKTFDCYFSPLAISAFNLSWMAAMWTACQMDCYMATTEFLWSVPCSPQSLDISYAIHPEDAKALWDSVHKTPGEVTQEEVDLFMDCLYSHFHRHFKIHLSATRLVRVSTSVASAHTDGKVKILCHKYLIGVLAYLTELAIFQIE
ncbi:centromere protein L isoform X3 [Ictidomys tridecemlineatus]|uniref:centromere protein L isoform X3 n=1 Tax=Ictidomys tridecemlineatus TaxID=43179 RepID=UPI001AA00903|nr:centromere protein L isoform X3 [Ictidomys tridecemlineatus]